VFLTEIHLRNEKMKIKDYVTYCIQSALLREKINIVIAEIFHLQEFSKES